jgi:hypothetical protein
MHKVIGLLLNAAAIAKAIAHFNVPCRSNRVAADARKVGSPPHAGVERGAGMRLTFSLCWTVPQS